MRSTTELQPQTDLLSEEWWSRGGSNPRPRHCERRALPTELRPRPATAVKYPNAFRKCNHFSQTPSPPTGTGRAFAAMNVRRHRKILEVDGRVAFVGGLNIRHGNCLSENPPSPIRDVHFQVCGPVVEQLQHSFAADWEFCTGEELIGEDWFPRLKPSGNMAARVITDGPDADIDKLTWMLRGAMSCAQESLWIVSAGPTVNLLDHHCGVAWCQGEHRSAGEQQSENHSRRIKGCVVAATGARLPNLVDRRNVRSFEDHDRGRCLVTGRFRQFGTRAA